MDPNGAGVAFSYTNHFASHQVANVVRTQLYPWGGQQWQLSGGTAEVGRIYYSTPAGHPAIVIYTGTTAPSNTNPLYLYNYGYGGGIGTVNTGTFALGTLYAYSDATTLASVYGFASSTTAGTSADTGMSRLGAASMAIGNGTAGNTSGNLSYNRVNLAGADYAGTVTITAAATTQAVSYAANYTGTAAPVVVATPTSDPLALGVPVGYWVTPMGSAGAWTGFTMNIQTALAGNVTFNYIVVGKA
jgi:hypothetical protein